MGSGGCGHLEVSWGRNGGHWDWRIFESLETREESLDLIVARSVVELELIWDKLDGLISSEYCRTRGTKGVLLRNRCDKRLVLCDEINRRLQWFVELVDEGELVDGGRVEGCIIQG